ncbi:putative ribonuclease H-like domain-containing protein [Tanacetum coccineum]
MLWSSSSIYQPNGSQLVYEDLEQIHEDDTDEMDLKWQLELISMRTRRGPRNQDSRNKNQENSRRAVNVEETSSKAMVAIDGTGFDWSYLADDELEKLKKDKESNQLKIENFDNASKSLDKLIGSQITNKSRRGVGFVSYNVVPPPHTGLFSPPNLDLSYSSLEEFQQPEFEGYGPKTSKSVSEDIYNDKLEKKTVSPTVTKMEFVRPKQQEKPVKLTTITIKGKRWYLGISYTRCEFTNYSAKKAHPSAHRNMAPRAVLMNISLRPLNTARPVNIAHPKTTVYSARPMSRSSTKEDSGYFDSGCSRHMTGNMSYLSNFKEFDRGYVTFGRGANGGKITGKGTIKNVFFFNDTGCFVLSPDFKLAYESQVLLKVPRKNNIYSVDIKNIVPKKSVAERRNRTLIDAARTMLADSKLPTTFWDDRVKLYCCTEESFGAGHFSKETGLVQDLHFDCHYEEGDEGVCKESGIADQEKPENSTQDVNNVGLKVDMSNITTTYLVPSTPNTRIHKDHSLDHVIGDVQSGNPRSNSSFDDPSGKAMQDELLQFRLQKGYTQEEGIGYDKVFAPVARIEATRLFLAYVSFMNFFVYQMDMKSAFLYGKIKEEVYVYQPPGFEDPEFPDRVYKVEKALYGLHQAPRAWYETLSTYLLANGFQRGTIDKTLFIKKVMQKEDGIFISQDKYVDEILKKFGFSTVRIASTPMETSKPLLKDAEAEDVDVHLYRSMIGSLMYLTASRPDIMFVVCACARFQVTPKVSHLHAVKRIFRYLKGQPKLGLWYPKDSPFDLEAYSDSDYAGASLDRKSTTGGCQFLGSRLISWQCKKQTIVANSTTEAEYVAAANCYGQVLWIQNQMLDYGYNFVNTKIFIDNESTICVVKNPVFHSKTKHNEIRHHFIRDSYEKRLIQVIKIHTDHNVADLLTKALYVSRL